MTPIVAFVVVDLVVKRLGRTTASRVLREHKWITALAFGWGIWPVWIQEYSYE